MSPRSLRSLWGFALTLALTTGPACHPAEGEATGPRIDPTKAAASAADLKVAREGALSVAQAGATQVDARARAMAEAVYDTLPTPAWSHFPGLEGERVRAPLRVEPPTKPGPVLFLMMDTTRADSLSAYGYERKTSPALEDIASEGIRLTRFYGNGAWTRPSVASMMTSLYRSEHGVEVTPPSLKEEALTAAEIFKEAGYATAAFVGNQTVRAQYNFHQGFDRYDDIFDELSHDPPAGLLIDRAIDWIDKNDNPQWFVWVFMVDPHDPYNPDKSYDKWEKGYKKWAGTPDIEYPEALEEGYTKRIKALYEAEIREMDDAIGRMVAHLREAGRWDNLTVVVAADHGEAFGEHNCYMHAFHFWEKNINLPIIYKSPAIASGAGLIEDRLSEGVDVLPTVLDLSGVASPEGWEPSGRSLAQLWSGPITEGWDHSVYTELVAYGITRDMVRRGDYKYMRFGPTYMGEFKHYWPEAHVNLRSAFHSDTREYLFNVAEDPGELKNLLQTEPTLAKALSRELDAFKTSMEDAGGADDGGVVEELTPEEIEDLRRLGYVE